MSMPMSRLFLRTDCISRRSEDARTSFGFTLKESLLVEI